MADRPELENVYLSGNFAPVGAELDVGTLPVQGEVPAFLEGKTYIRNGSNAQFAPIVDYHWFDGDGMLHAVSFDRTGPRYRNVWIETSALLAERRAGRALFGGFRKLRFPEADLLLEPPPLVPIKNTANTHIVAHAGRLLALCEWAHPYEIDAPSLRTRGPYDFDGALGLSMCAHPRFDPRSGEMWFFSTSVAPPYLTLYSVGPDGRIILERPIDVPGPLLIHDFMLTASWAVFLLNPVVIDPAAAVAGGEGMQWRPERGAEVLLVPRSPDASIVRFEMDPCFVFHFANAWEEPDGRITFEAPRFERFVVVDRSDFVAPHQTRFEVDPAGLVKAEQLDDIACEFPRIDDRRAGSKHRYCWVAARTDAVPDGAPIVETDAVARYDNESRTRSLHALGPGRFCSEPVFVPREQDAGEGDGAVLTYVFDASERTSFLYVFDASGIEAGPVARIRLPQRVPYGFHGNWFDFASER
jgi:carotenoid cleavage dioxygenase